MIWRTLAFRRSRSFVFPNYSNNFSHLLSSEYGMLMCTCIYRSITCLAKLLRTYLHEEAFKKHKPVVEAVENVVYLICRHVFCVLTLSFSCSYKCGVLCMWIIKKKLYLFKHYIINLTTHILVSFNKHID